MIISGFSFVHNAFTGGYPILEAIRVVEPYVDEMIVINCQSTDETKEALLRHGVTVIDGPWGSNAGETLAEIHALHAKHCQGDTIIHFEADEVFDENLIYIISNSIKEGLNDLAVYRLQVESNFQRCRWYPELVHRVFPQGSVIKVGASTNRHNEAVEIPPEMGFLWDCTNVFRDTYFNRVNQNAKLWGTDPQYIMTPLHTIHESRLTFEQANEELSKDYWTWAISPFDLPEVLKPLVGMTRYVDLRSFGND